MESGEEFRAPYVIHLGQFESAMLDSASVNESLLVPEQAKVFTRQLRSLRAANAWLVDHHPFWAIRLEPDRPQFVCNTPSLKAAWEGTSERHQPPRKRAHALVRDDESERRPSVQLVAGDGGSSLHNPLPMRLEDKQVAGAAIVRGYTAVTKAAEGWDIALKNPKGRNPRNLYGARVPKSLPRWETGRPIGRSPG